MAWHQDVGAYKRGLVSMDWMDILFRFGFIGEAIMLLLVSKFARDLLMVARGYHPRELITLKGNVAYGVDLGCYLLAFSLALYSSIGIQSEEWLGQASEIATTGFLVMGLLLLADWLTDWVLFRGIDDHHEVCERDNLAVAIARSGAVIGTGLILSGALGDGTTQHAYETHEWLISCGLWFVMGQLALIATAMAYRRLPPFDDLAELKDHNIAVALPTAGILVSIGIAFHAGLHGVTVDWLVDLKAVALYLVSTVILLFIMRFVTDWILLPHVKLDDEITQDRNMGAGFIEGMTYCVSAYIISFFLT